MNTYPQATITEKGEKLLRGGHVWVYADEVLSVDAPYENGDLVKVLSGKGKFLGCGFINDHSKIRIRIVSTNANDRFDNAFWERRVHYALDYRRCVMGRALSPDLRRGGRFSRTDGRPFRRGAGSAGPFPRH